MKNIQTTLSVIISFGLLLSSTSAFAAIDPAADKVSLRTSCSINGNPQDNCFSNWWSLNSWISTIRHPNETSPLEVDIGPGSFGPNYDAGATHLILNCNPSAGYTGSISYVGAGSNQTILTGQGGGNFSPLVVNSCTKMNFAHLQISNPNQGISGYGAIEWNGGGISSWDDVQVIGNGRAWYETTCGATPGQHTWNNSQVIGRIAFTVAVTYLATCDSSQFYGSAISIQVPETYSGVVSNGGAVVATDAGDIHLYGSHLIAQIDAGGSYSNNAVAASASNGGKIHIHGTGIDVTSNSGQNVTALAASSGGMIHANSSAYFMQSTGQMTRISNNGGMVMAPYQWQEGATPPNIVSANGSDQSVITATTDGHPHLVVYDTTCASKWYDTNLNACH